MTFRHDGKGLPTQIGVVIVLLTLGYLFISLSMFLTSEGPKPDTISYIILAIGVAAAGRLHYIKAGLASVSMLALFFAASGIFSIVACFTSSQVGSIINIVYIVWTVPAWFKFAFKISVNKDQHN